MNAMAQEILGTQAKSSQLTSETTKITVYEKIKFLGDSEKLVNFVDIPGLSDSSGNDQKILDMTASMKPQCPKIDLFVLCFEKGKFDATIQDIITAYQDLTGKNKKLWTNMVAVITKVQYSQEDHDSFEGWKEEMNQWRAGLDK